MSDWIKHKSGDERPVPVEHLYALKDGWGNVFYADGSIMITAEFIASEYDVSRSHSFKRAVSDDRLWNEKDCHVDNFVAYKLKKEFEKC